MPQARRGLTALLLMLAIPPSTASAAFGDRSLNRGDRGHDVRVLQSWLTKLGFRTQVDGVFGSGTRRSLRRWERRERLDPDGRLARAEARRMRRRIEGGRRSRGRKATFGSRTLRRGDRGHDVRVLQGWLTRLGVATTVDGVFGRGTERGLRRWEEMSGVEPDGVLARAEAARMRRQVEGGESRPTPVADGEHVYPVQGPHRYGDGFGAARSGRSHRGQDVFAACGTPLVAAQGGRVLYAGYHSAAGNYIVVTGERSGEDYVYMHLRRPASAGEGDTVATGARIGEVGETGNASGCHLHFELWTRPGWYRGGEPYDPRPALESWESASAAASSAG